MTGRGHKAVATYSLSHLRSSSASSNKNFDSKGTQFCLLLSPIETATCKFGNLLKIRSTNANARAFRATAR
jgi:hypothetical protein